MRGLTPAYAKPHSIATRTKPVRLFTRSFLKTLRRWAKPIIHGKSEVETTSRQVGTKTPTPLLIGSAERTAEQEGTSRGRLPPYTFGGALPRPLLGLRKSAAAKYRTGGDFRLEFRRPPVVLTLMRVTNRHAAACLAALLLVLPLVAQAQASQPAVAAPAVSCEQHLARAKELLTLDPDSALVHALVAEE